MILNGLHKRSDETKGTRIEEFLVVLWSYNTTPQSATGETPCGLVYGEDAMIPIEQSERTWRVLAFNEEGNGSNMGASLNHLLEV